ncbi:MAG TPA: hypothetical protein VF160_09920 [Candidatus Dormibacteraeota bacterium]
MGGGRTVRLGGRTYRVLLPSIRDPRLHVAAVLLTLQVLGQTVLDFRLSVAQILVCLAAGALIEFTVPFFKDNAIMWPASGLLTGNSVAFILRVPGTLHGQWWSLRGAWIFLGVVAVSMLSKYLIRWRGRHIFNPSNLGLVLAFVALGPQNTEPQDLWWIQPTSPWMLLTYAILICGGLLIAKELKLLGLEIGFMAGFAAFTGLALWLVPDHCMVASWHVTPLCGLDLWQILAISPEVMIFGFFMVPDPRTVPDGQAARGVFGVFVALLSALLLGPTTLEFWTKTAILASLVIACALRFLLARLLAPLDEGEGFAPLARRLPATLPLALLMIWALPIAADLATHGPLPAAGLPDRTAAVIGLHVGSGPGPAVWLPGAAAAALPPPRGTAPAPASATLYVLPPIPTLTIPSNVQAFDSTITPQTAATMAHDLVLDLMIESEARRTHDTQLARQGAIDDGLTEFTDVIKDDTANGRIVQKTYSFDQCGLALYLPKFATQAPRLVGVALHGTTTLTTWDAQGHQVAQSTQSYTKSWGVAVPSGGGHMVIINDYTDLNPA